MDLKVLLPAELIPDGSTVSKRTGDTEYTLKHNLTVYHFEQKLELAGYYLVGSRGHINQVHGDTLLHWVVDSQTFIDHLQYETPQ